MLILVIDISRVIKSTYSLNEVMIEIYASYNEI